MDFLRELPDLFLVCTYIADKIPLNVGSKCGLKENLIFLFAILNNS